MTTLLSRRTVEAGTRDSEYTTTLFDYTAGLRGKLTNTIDWDVSASYGQSENIARATGYLINDRVLEALQATNPNTCLSGNVACVPLNVYGPAGSITPAMARFISADTTDRRTSSLTQVRALLSGDLAAVIAQNPGHLARSALRVLRAKADRQPIDEGQEQLRIEIVIRENLPAFPMDDAQANAA